MRAAVVNLLSLFLTAFSLGSPASLRAQDSDLVAKTTNALGYQESTVESYSVVVEAATFNLHFGGSGKTRFTSRETWRVEPSGRGWYLGHSDKLRVNRDGTRHKSKVKQEAFFDGDSGIQLTTEVRRPGGRPGLSANKLTYVRGLTISPLDFTIAHQGKLVSQTLKNRKTKVVSEQEYDGRVMKIVETEAVENSFFYKSQYWVDPERGYAIARRINLVSRSAEGPWFPSYEVDAFDHVEVAPGIWLPTRFESYSYGSVPKEASTAPTVMMVTKGSCNGWSIDQPIEADRLTLKVPRSVRVRPIGREHEKQPVEKLRNFFVLPVTTALQRRLVGDNVDAFGAIDVTSYVNTETKHLELEYCDFKEFKRQLNAAGRENPNGSLRLHFDFGTVGTDQMLRRFVTGPIEAMAEEAGFRQVRSSHFFHQEALFLVPEVDEQDLHQEEDLGSDACSIFPVRTTISKYRLGELDYLIVPTRPLEIDADELLDEHTANSIRDSLFGLEIDGDSALIEFKLGEERVFKPGQGNEPPARLQDSKIQLQVVNQLRSIGFGDIKISVRIGNNVRDAYYEHSR